MNYIQLQNYFLLGLLLVVLALFSWMLSPYLYGLSIALVAVIVAWPLHARLRARIGRPSLAALIMTTIVLIAILVPLLILGGQLVNEALTLYQRLEFAGYHLSTLDNLRLALEGRLQAYVPGLALSLPSFDISQYLQVSATWIATKGFGIAGNAVGVVANIMVFLFALYFLFRDGEKLRTIIMNLSLLSDEDDANILSRAGATINAVVRGSLAVALVQGIIAAVGFKLFGIPSPVLLGFVTMCMALIPGIGTALVIVPAVGFLFITGETMSAIGLLAWGTVAVGLVDNLLRPVLLERSVKIHPFLVLLSVIGGFTIFGVIGFVFGPVLLSLLVTLYSIYSLFISKNFAKTNMPQL